MKNLLRYGIILGLAMLFCTKSFAWGFWGHQRINRMAVFTLPPDMMKLYKLHIEYLTDHAVDPDKRRYAVEYEAPRHYVDVDHYGEFPFEMVPRKWFPAVDKYTEDTLNAYGIVPWHINLEYKRLVKAFEEKNLGKIIKISADIGHYIADSNVPLHTTENYNGQMTGQRGIHGLWESRLPEIFGLEYNYFLGRAPYIESPLLEAWSSVLESHAALDSVLAFERELTESLPSDRKYSFENRNDNLTRVYSNEFCTKYHQMLNGQVERRLRTSVKRVGGIWFTAWVDAGQPDLEELLIEELKMNPEKFERKFRIKDRESQAIGAIDWDFLPNVFDPSAIVLDSGSKLKMKGHACGHDHGSHSLYDYQEFDTRNAMVYPGSLKLLFRISEIV